MVLCFGALSDALGAEAPSNPPEVSRGQGSPPSAAAAPSPPDYSTLYESLFYPHDERPSGLARDGAQPLGNYYYEGEDENDVYPDQEGDVEETGRALMDPRDVGENTKAAEAGLKRSMGMLRLGRRSLVGKRPRTMAALRLGRSVVPEAAWRKRSMGMLRLGRSEQAEDEEEEEKRSMGILRLGRRSRPLGAEDKRSMGMLRLGRSEGLRRQSLGR